MPPWCRMRWLLPFLVIGGCADSGDRDDSAGESDVSDWCVDHCKMVGEELVPEALVDPESYDAGCEELGARSCDECNRALGEYLSEYDVLSDCYCLVEESQRDEAVVLADECAWIISEYYGGDVRNLQDTCTCD